MNKKLFIGIFIGALLCTGLWIFFKKHQIKFELHCEIPILTDAYPLGYEFIHNQESFDNFFDRTSETREFKIFLPDSLDFDFKKYSYCIVSGCKANAIWHSYKSEMFDDISPTYARPSNRTVVFIDAKECYRHEQHTFIYRMKKNIRLRGFFGC